MTSNLRPLGREIRDNVSLMGYPSFRQQQAAITFSAAEITMITIGALVTMAAIGWLWFLYKKRNV